MKGKTAVVTGGNSGIGYAAVEELKKSGAKVLFTGRKQSLVSEAAKKLDAIGVVSDQSDLSQIDKLVTKTNDELGKVDILVINAGVFNVIPFEMVTESVFDAISNVNQKGVFFTLQKFLPILNDNASVILTSALGATTNGAPATSVYNATRAALNSYVRSLSFELAPKGIRINSVSPGPIETPIFTKAGLPAEAMQGMAAAMQQKIPLKRFGTASDVAKLISFLSSDDSSFITGSEYLIDGGIGRVPVMS